MSDGAFATQIVLAHLRGRSLTEGELAAATSLPPDEVRSALEYLAAEGHLALDAPENLPPASWHWRAVP